MIILKYNQKNHRKIIRACIIALRAGKTVVYPTDTSYGIACDPENKKSLDRFYKIKDRPKRQPIHVIPASISAAKLLVVWNELAQKLATRFWPGPLTIILPLKAPSPVLKQFSGADQFLGIRIPANSIARDLAKKLGRPIPATSANAAGQPDCYTISDLVAQYEGKKYKPDIIIDVGRLPKKRPSTLVKIDGNMVSILRIGPINKKQIKLTTIESKAL